MILDDLIRRLNELKDGSEMRAPIDGGVTVYVNCPVAREDCWLHPDKIRVVSSDGYKNVVVINGGFGA